ncbi:hypothetical protein GCM10020219_064740 [Nonomuraea dietziae]
MAGSGTHAAEAAEKAAAEGAAGETRAVSARARRAANRVTARMVTIGGRLDKTRKAKIFIYWLCNVNYRHQS